MKGLVKCSCGNQYLVVFENNMFFVKKIEEDKKI